MATLLSILVDGVAYGMILFMISVGLSVTMGLMRVINLAHGGFALLGGALAHWLMATAGLPLRAGAAGLAMVAVVLIALPMERVMYRPHLPDGRVAAGAGDHRHHLHDDRQRQSLARLVASGDPDCRRPCRARWTSGFAPCRCTGSR